MNVTEKIEILFASETMKDLREKLNKNQEKHKQTQNDNRKRNSSGSFVVSSKHSSSDPNIEIHKVQQGIKQRILFDRDDCEEIEAKIDEVVEQAELGAFKDKTVDRAPLRVKTVCVEMDYDYDY